MNINVVIPDYLTVTADKLAQRLGISRNELIRMALLRFLEENHANAEPVTTTAADADEDW
jgi:metal-responsive CopG/Arc/MetJ family transcriptional regulator